MESSQSSCHVFLVCFPGQGHINPLLRLGKRLAAKGLLVTFSSTLSIGKDMKKAGSISDQPTPVGNGFIRFEFFDDGCEEVDKRRTDLDFYMPQLERYGKVSLPQMMKKNSEENRPVSCLVGNPFLPWVSDVANELQIPSAVFWVQSCAVFSAYYHSFHNLVPFPSQDEPTIDVQLPCMPVLKSDEIPSFLDPNSSYKVLGKVILSQFKSLSKSLCIFMDTFQELEHEIINYMSKFCAIKPVGPLFMTPKTLTSNGTVRGDILKASDDCIEWLNSKPKSSVLYISFGSIVYLTQEQVDELAYGVWNSGVSFLWVIKPPNEDFGNKRHVLPDEISEKLGERGKIVQWSPQEQVLSHSSVACFLTHCGWNSSVEALSLGVPVITFPQWGDQVTNAKFLVDVFGVGARLSRGIAEERLIGRDEIEKCLIEATSGKRGAEMKENALKWKKAAAEAVSDDGSSDRNIQDFVHIIKEIAVRTTPKINNSVA